MGTLMLEDQHGLTISTSSTEAAVGFDRMVNAYLKYRTDASQHLARTLAADSGFGLLARGSKKQRSTPCPRTLNSAVAVIGRAVAGKLMEPIRPLACYIKSLAKNNKTILMVQPLTFAVPFMRRRDHRVGC